MSSSLSDDLVSHVVLFCVVVQSSTDGRRSGRTCFGGETMGSAHNAVRRLHRITLVYVALYSARLTHAKTHTHVVSLCILGFSPTH